MNVRKHLAEHRKLLGEYPSEFAELNLIIPCSQGAWKAALHLVSKDSKAIFRTTVDLRPLNAAAVPEQWPMLMV